MHITMIETARGPSWGLTADCRAAMGLQWAPSRPRLCLAPDKSCEASERTAELYHKVPSFSKDTLSKTASRREMFSVRA
jgi:hypothetical protein